MNPRQSRGAVGRTESHEHNGWNANHEILRTGCTTARNPLPPVQVSHHLP
jgi:hypothetical protein